MHNKNDHGLWKCRPLQIIVSGGLKSPAGLWPKTNACFLKPKHVSFFFCLGFCAGPQTALHSRDLKIEGLESDLFIRRSRYHHLEAFFEIYKMGMISHAKYVNRKNKRNKKTAMVGFSRTEVSIPPVRILVDGTRWSWFQRPTNWTVAMKKKQ